MIIFTIVYPKNDRLAEGAQKAIYDRFGVLPDLSSRRVVQYQERYRLVRARNSDVPSIVDSMPYGSYGITTEDIFRDYKLGIRRRGVNISSYSPSLIDSYLDFGSSKICLLGKQDVEERKDWQMRSSSGFLPAQISIKARLIYTVATKPSYENLTYDYIFVPRRRFMARIIVRGGELEGLPELEVADFIVDSVETGKSAEENGLIEYGKIMDSRAIWIWGKPPWLSE